MTEKYLTFDQNSCHNEDIGEVLFLGAFFDDDKGCLDPPKFYGKFHIQRVFCHQHQYLWNFPLEQKNFLKNKQVGKAQKLNDQNKFQIIQTQFKNYISLQLILKKIDFYEVFF